MELLKQRGIESDEDIEEFISDKPQRMYDPFLLPDMEAGVDLILSSVNNGEKICIYGDYDCDGVTSTAILYTVLTQLTDKSKVSYHIPSRFSEGYGLNKPALKEIRDNGVDLVVTVDCGSVSVDEVEYAKEIGLKILVTDHHTITDKRADCLLINPARPDSKYPCPYLAGCGVAFKLSQALVSKTGLKKGLLVSLMELEALGPIGDIVPLVDENRALAKYGIRVINTRRRKNLDLLIRTIGLTPGKITAENISYIIVPHINAAGRMKSAYTALKLFITEDDREAAELASELAELNERRKSLQNHIFDEAVNVIEERYKDDKFILVDMGDAHEGVTGIVAGKLKERYYKPAVVLTHTKDGRLKGTGRSVEGVNLYDLLKPNEEFFYTFGGHAGACGFTMKPEALEALRDNLNREAAEIAAVKPALFQKHIEMDMELQPRDISYDFVEQLDVLEPCGCANERPVFGFDAFTSSVGRMGKEGQYLRFNASPGNGRRVTCVCFNDADRVQGVIDQAQGEPVKIIGQLSERLWQGNKYMQMNVMDVVDF